MSMYIIDDTLMDKDEVFAEFAYRLFMLRYDLADALIELRKHEPGMHKPFCVALRQLIDHLNNIQTFALEIEEARNELRADR